MSSTYVGCLGGVRECGEVMCDVLRLRNKENNSSSIGRMQLDDVKWTPPQAPPYSNVNLNDGAAATAVVAC